MPCREVNDHFGNKERIEPGIAIAFGKVGNFIIKRGESADTRAPDYTTTCRVELGNISATVYKCFISAYKGVLGKGIQFPGFLFLHEIFGVKTLEFTGKTGPELGGVKTGDKISSAHTIGKPLPECFGSIADGG